MMSLVTLNVKATPAVNCMTFFFGRNLGNLKTNIIPWKPIALPHTSLVVMSDKVINCV